MTNDGANRGDLTDWGFGFRYSLVNLRSSFGIRHSAFISQPWNR